MRRWKLLLLGLFALSGAAQAAIVIGQSVPLTGVASGYGKGLAEGAAAYFNTLNSKGGINGEEVRFISYDDAFDTQRTLANTRKLIDKDKAVALLGYYGEDAVIELMSHRWLEGAGIPLVGVASGVRMIRVPGSPNVFHSRASQRDEIAKMVTQMHGLGIDKIGVFYQDDGFGREGLDAAKEAAKANNMQITVQASYLTNKLDMKAAAEKMANANPPAILMISITKPAGAFIKELREAGCGSVLYHTSTVDFEQLVKDIGAGTAHGLAIAQVYPYAWDSRNKLIREFRQAMQDYDANATISYAALEGYINAKLLSDAIKRAGSGSDRAKVLAALTNLGEVDYQGFHVTFGPNRREGSKFVDLTIVNVKGELSR
ncbi:ABC transporter substrate-binding protein [Chitinimonas sp.]|uniref:ABC transporter substrate-binding protein n=1 Tax=Chitinimonas sp. TaxID=1934313 RepID=UPI0035AE91F8